MKDVAVALTVLQLRNEIRRDKSTQEKVGQLTSENTDEERHDEDNDFIQLPPQNLWLRINVSSVPSPRLITSIPW